MASCVTTTAPSDALVPISFVQLSLPGVVAIRRRSKVRKRRTRQTGALDASRWGHLFERKLTKAEIKHRSGFEVDRLQGVIAPLRKSYYYVKDQPVGGDAPKDFIRVYEPGEGRRNSPRDWPAHIAKVGHKWYPAESITEQLMTVIGETLGIRMAQSQLALGEGQIRFLSRYFLGKDESLDHGAQIVAGYLADEPFVKAIEAQGIERDIITFQDLCDAIRTRFPSNYREILPDFVRMIGFDALVGNQDRHLYNWGVISDTRGVRPPRFSPIYDTARGLFWNESEVGLARFGRSETALDKYIRTASPLIGWDLRSGEIPNHFGLIRTVITCDAYYGPVLEPMGGPKALASIGKQIDEKFSRLLSEPRRHLIKECLRRRFELYEAALGLRQI